MLTTILDEAVNGWVLTIFGGPTGKQVFIYESLTEAQEHRNITEINYSFYKVEGVNKNASHS